ncbi:MAG TPA: hypothetical protein VHU19_11870 [Pyrinomonadaceae bacterium]|jgi:hypothetical protein|nr:hypothetical protein [Pyrinomonadaceae bacterium]
MLNTTERPADIVKEETPTYQHQLGAANGFTWDDVLENREGRISGRQGKIQSKDSRARTGGIAGGVFFVLIGFVGVYLSLEKGPFFLIISLICIAGGVYQIIGKSKKSDNEVESFEGVLKKKSVLRERSKGGGLAQALAAKAVASALDLRDYYYACEGGPDIKVSRAGHDALQENLRHRVYYTPYGKMLLSVEVVSN